MDFNKPIGEQLGNNIQEKTSDFIANVGDTFSNLGENAANAKDGFNSMVSDFSSPKIADVGSAFLDTNSIIAKFVFLIVVLIGFFLVFNLGIYILSWFAAPNRSPYIFKGMKYTNLKYHIKQDPKQNGKPIYRSNNEDKGIEFTWSSWLKLKLPTDTDTDTDTDGKHIFNKGTDPDGTFIKNAPGVYANNPNNTLQLTIKMDIISGSTKTKEIKLHDLPINKWFHLAIRLQNKIVDIYVNGTITTRIPLDGVPNQNYGDIYVGYGGLEGTISNLRYFDRALSVFQISNIVMTGPDLSNPDENQKIDKANYLSNNWYSNAEY